MSTKGSTSDMTFPPDWHTGPDDSFHGKITKDGPFQPEKDRYHLYIGLFCPFAHRANLVRKLKQLDKYAGIDISIVKPYPKDEPDTPSKPGWRFNLKEESQYEGATEDKLFGYRYMNEVYFRADKSYKGKYTVPALWDKKLNTMVNNESAELLRDLQTAFDELLPKDVAEVTLYPKELQGEIDTVAGWMSDHLNTGVYKAGFAPNQEVYNKNLPTVFAALNKLEKLTKHHGGPYILGAKMTELDVRAYATIVRFDTVYVQHFKCNLGMIRYSYPVLHNWLKGTYFNEEAYRETTDFRHIKENYTKSHLDINPKGVTPMGPWPEVEEGYEKDWNLILLAHDLNDQLQKAILEAQNLTTLAKPTPRPSTPPPRDPLFQRTKDAPLSDYEKRAKAYNAIVARYQRVQINLRVLQEKVASYREDVRGLEARFVPARKMKKVKHDVEAVGNAAGNLEEGVVRLGVEVGEARRAAM
ncbi:hypothetical protein LTR35_008791 [Friedmanniomyces endolithicus]|uniref:GST N-terminal domain-containing protein n=1 Tax=Friedmanniomyces endolithicus TaxID=329885 RepID=A0AAN6J1V3_9PEZI|nr:hypothetical protein LTR35_008791 [Friedmanniomyces endolithicus]KAK0295026.1 hypothetical protein LTS00_006492 [Friedmanniomyces endolithicus]KAK0310161.1 hypothetical protein LTR82_014984 [Friedmanniomyces endolithicus]KAK0990678.1 hypothetical protein LTR54_012038 [Friedmanniomyces endolithicus]